MPVQIHHNNVGRSLLAAQKSLAFLCEITGAPSKASALCTQGALLHGGRVARQPMRQRSAKPFLIEPHPLPPEHLDGPMLLQLCEGNVLRPWIRTSHQKWHSTRVHFCLSQLSPLKNTADICRPVQQGQQQIAWCSMTSQLGIRHHNTDPVSRTWLAKKG